MTLSFDSVLTRSESNVFLKINPRGLGIGSSGSVFVFVGGDADGGLVMVCLD